MRDLSNKNVIHVKKDGIEYLQFRKLLKYSDIINHAYSLGLNTNYRTRKKSPENSSWEEENNNAIRDYKNLCTAIGTNYINLMKPRQSHTKNVISIKRKINVDKPDFNLDEYDLADGVVTDKKNIILSTTNADCIILLFFDPIKKAIANVHSVWKGTLNRISVEAVRKMKTEYECNPKDIICCICPSIRQCHFEVRKDVQEPYYNEFKELKDINEIIVPIPGEEKWYIDTVRINKEILKQEGLLEENIIDSEICSVCNSDLVHSYRVEKTGFKIGTAIIELKK